VAYSHKWLFLLISIPLLTYAILSPEADNSQATDFEQGWPMVYVSRTSDGKPETQWGSFLRIYKDVNGFYAEALLLDLLFVISVTYIICWLWHLHCATLKPWQFSLKEALIVMVLCFLCFSALKYFQNAREADINFLWEIGDQGFSPDSCVDAVPWVLRPLRDVGIIQELDWEYPGFVWDPETEKNKSYFIAPKTINEALDSLATQYGPRPFIHSVLISDPQLNINGVKALCKLVPNCTMLFLGNDSPNITDEEISYITSHLKNLHTLSLHGTKLTDESVKSLSTLRKVRDLSFDDRYKTTTNEGLKSLLALPRILNLGIPIHWQATENEKMIIRNQRTSVYFITPDERYLDEPEMEDGSNPEIQDNTFDAESNPTKRAEKRD
jgi:hypothetical protein